MFKLGLKIQISKIALVRHIEKWRHPRWPAKENKKMLDGSGGRFRLRHVCSGGHSPRRHVCLHLHIN